MIVRKELEAMAMPYSSDYVHPIYSDDSCQPSTSAESSTKTITTTTINKSMPTTRARSNSMQAIRSLFKSMISVTNSPTDEVVLRRNEKREQLFMRPGIIEEEPDSMDSIISDPSSFPITIVPPVTSGGAGLLIRNSTAHSSIGRLSRISTKWVSFFYVQ